MDPYSLVVLLVLIANITAFLLGSSIGNLLEEEKINRIFNFMWEGTWVEGFIEVVLSFIVITKSGGLQCF